jgi:hypothetical protein
MNRMMQKSNQAKPVIHAYLKGTLASGYRECSLCNNRTCSICVKCRGCYTCHCKLLSEQSLPQQQKLKQEYQRKVIDVYGQQIASTCNHRTCNHKLSTHGHSSRTCKCRHPINYAAGVSLKTDCMTYD